MMADRVDAMIHQVKITEIRIKPPYVKIFVQNIKSSNYQKLQCLQHLYMTLSNGGEVGDMCLIKSEGEFYRCRVLDVVNDSARLYLVDTGVCTMFPHNLLRIIPESHFFSSLPPVCKPVYLAELKINTNVPDYYEKIKSKLNYFLRNKIVALKVVAEVPPKSLAHIEINGRPFIDDILFNDSTCAGIFNIVEISDQLGDLIKSPEPRIIPESPEEKKVAKPTTQKLALEGQHDVKVIECKDGPREFYVKFVSHQHEEEYKKFQNLLNMAILQPLIELPAVNTRVIALLSPNKSKMLEALRGIVQKVDNINQIRIYLVDMGREMIVKQSNLYITTDEVQNYPPFVTKFSLQGLASTECLIKEEVDFYFRYITQNQNLKLTVVPSRTADIPLCTLKKAKDDSDILSLIKAYDPHSFAYPSQTILKPGNYRVHVSAFESVNSFYITLLDKKESVASDERYLAHLNACELKFPSPGNVCYVKVKDGFHRGKFLKRVSSEEIPCSEVQLVDYGTIVRVNHSDVKVLVEKLLKNPPAAYHCCLSDWKDFDGDYYKLKNIMKLISKENCVSVESFEDGMYYVKILDDVNDPDIVEHYRDGLRDPIIVRKEVTGWESVNDSVEWSTIEDKNVEFCQISCVTSINDFTIQLIKDLPQLEKSRAMWQHIMKNVSEKCLTEVSKVKENEVYVVHDEDKNVWNRVALLKEEKINNKHVFTMRNIDDGSVLTIEKPIYEDVYEIYDRENLKPVRVVVIGMDKRKKDAKVMNIEDGTIITVKATDVYKAKKSSEWFDRVKLFEAPVEVRVAYPAGFRCSLACIPIKHHDQEATEYLMNLAGKNLTYKILHATPQYSTISLFQDGSSVLNELLKLKYVRKLSILPSGSAFISHIEHLKEFYIVQTDLSWQTLKIIKDYAEKQYKHIAVIDPKIGMLVMAKYKVDKLWYRAKITKIEDNKISVKYTDFGNKAELKLSDIGQITEQWLFDETPLAAKCALDLPDDLCPSSPEAVGYFKRFAKLGECTFKFELIRATEDYSIIKIFKENEKSKKEVDLLNEIKKLCLSLSDDENVKEDEASVKSSESENSIANFGNCLKKGVRFADDWSSSDNSK